MPDKISIALASYNGEAFLQEQLDSFTAQERKPDELIITDDHSDDRTVEIAEAYAATAPFEVNVYRNQRRLGYCGNFNAALGYTTGELVFLCDQDDVWFPEKISTVMNLMEQHPEASLILNDAAMTDGNLQDSGRTKIQQIQSAGYSMEKFVMGCCCSIRRDLLDICLPIPASYSSHDNWLAHMAGGLDLKWVEPVILQYYRRHGENASQGFFNQTREINRTLRFLHSAKRILKGKMLQDLKDRGHDQSLLLERLDELIQQGRYEDTEQLRRFRTQTLRRIKRNSFFPTGNRTS